MTPPDTAQPLLLDVPECLSPRLRWMETHGITVITNDDFLLEVGLEGDCDPEALFWAMQPKGNGVHEAQAGPTESDACAEFARIHGLPHWLNPLPATPGQLALSL